MKKLRDKGAAIDWQAVRDRLSQAAEASAATDRPTPERVRAIFEERARAAARVPPKPLAAGEAIEVVRFDLGDERYAIETGFIREILRPKENTPLPGAPAFVIGVTNLRGQIVALLDLRRYFDLAAPDGTEMARIIVLGRERMEFGILADAVSEVARLHLDSLREPPESVAGIAREYLRGVTADALIVLDGAALLGDPRLYIDLNDDGGPVSA